jgi:hypothetical protein
LKVDFSVVAVGKAPRREDMNKPLIPAQDSVFKRILWLYGLYTLVFNICFVFAYYYLPEGFMRGSPQTAAGEIVAKSVSFWPQFGLTLLFNLGIMTTIAIVANFNQVRGFPVGYLVPITLAITGGLIVGTNSFVSDNLDRYSNVREAMALGQTVGGLETLGFILVIASTVSYGVYQYRSWWRWGGEWKPAKVMNLRDVRLSRQEILCLILGIVLLIIAAYRETGMQVSL